MQDIVATIQAEQDRIIRSDPSGVLVVQGGPGTGKTAVALHRAAYLLYTYRQQLETRGVLIVGPNATFLRYISQVLPSLAETGVLLCTLGDLFPGVRARRYEPAATAALKGRAAMAEVLAGRRRATGSGCPTSSSSSRSSSDTLRLDRWTCIEARNRARRSGRLHNLARPLFAAVSAGRARPSRWPSGSAPTRTRTTRSAGTTRRATRCCSARPTWPTSGASWRTSRPYRRCWTSCGRSSPRSGCWPTCSPTRHCWTRPRPTLTDGRTGAGCSASRAGGWTPADVPLLDEAGRAARRGRQRGPARRLEALRRARIEYAEGALEIVEGSRPLDVEDEEEPEILLATDLLDATALAERHEERGPAHHRPAGRGRPAAGRSGTSSSTRRRSCRRWRGGC